MQIARPLGRRLVYVAFSPIVLAAALAPSANPARTGHLEPGAPLQTSATLVTILDSGVVPQAVVRINMTSQDKNAVARVTTTDKGRGEKHLLANTTLQKGNLRSIRVVTDLVPDQENHLLYDVDATGPDGSTTHATVYLRVNLDQSLEPRIIDGYIEYQGAVSGEVQP